MRRAYGNFGMYGLRLLGMGFGEIVEWSGCSKGLGRLRDVVFENFGFQGKLAGKF